MANSVLKDGKKPEWKLFEEAVGAFLQALDVAAKVTNDVQVPDIDTGELRQRDVWIETTFGGHIPIKILVSCKRKKRRLSKQDIDAFVGELRSSGASKGVIYSFGGYSNSALIKAKKIGIACCTLYADRAPDLPQVMTFRSYCFREITRLRLFGGCITNSEQVKDILNEAVIFKTEKVNLSRILANGYEYNRPKLQDKPNAVNPPNWHYDLLLPSAESQGPITVRIEGGWRVYEAEQDAFLLNGSYSFENNDFKGSFSAPWVDRMSEHPGPGWTEIEPNAERPARNVVSTYLFGGDVEKLIRKQYGC